MGRALLSGLVAALGLCGCAQATIIEPAKETTDATSFAVGDAASGQLADVRPSMDAQPSPDLDEPADVEQPVDVERPAEVEQPVDTWVAPDITEDAEEPAPQPDPVTPCASASCWATSLQPQACSLATKNEDYSSGKYNVHHYASVAHPGAETTIRVERTAGQWQPAILVTRKDGSTLSDGELGATAAGVQVTVIKTGQAGGVAEVVIQTDEALGLDVFVTGWSVVDSSYGVFLGQDSKYTLLIDNLCDGQPALDCSGPIVNGNPVAEPACGWLNHIGKVVVPQLAGTLDERLDVAAPVAWWALKEGVLFLDNPIVYSNCNFDSGDKKIGPLEICADGHAWQVGLSGVQVPTFSLAVLNQTATDIFPGTSTDTILEQTAQQALLPPAQVAVVVASTDKLRRSWLLRNSPIGFTVQAQRVVKECVVGNKSWCHGTGWNATKLYAPTKAAAIQAIADIRGLLLQLSP